jgi:hypothetical protein
MEHSRELPGSCLRSSDALVGCQLQVHRNQGEIDAIRILPSVGMIGQIPINLMLRSV